MKITPTTWFTKDAKEDIGKILGILPENVKICGTSIYEVLNGNTDDQDFDIRVFDDNSKFDIYEIGVNGSRMRKLIATFKIMQLPGCCGVMLSFNSAVERDYRGKGLGTYLHELRCLLAKQHGYTTFLCTDRTHNTVQNKILQENNWKIIYQFENKRSGNLVNINVKDLSDASKEFTGANYLTEYSESKISRIKKYCYQLLSSYWLLAAYALLVSFLYFFY